MSEPVRPETALRLAALHAKIGNLIAAELRHYDETHPDQNSLHRSIAHTRIQMLAHSPEHSEADVRGADTLNCYI